MQQKKSVGADILAHTHHSVDLRYAKPVQDVWHQCLKSHVLHSCHIFCPLEVFGRLIGTTLSGIVNEILQVWKVSVIVKNHGECGITFVTSPKARPSFLKYITTPLPPFWASFTASSIPNIKYGRQVQILLENTSLELHSSWIRRARRALASAILAGSPKQYTVRPPTMRKHGKAEVIVLRTYWWQEYLDIPSRDKLRLLAWILTMSHAQNAASLPQGSFLPYVQRVNGAKYLHL